MKYTLIISLIMSSMSMLAQKTPVTEDSTEYAIDSVYFEERPNYIGANATPFVTSVIGASNKDAKISFLYKRNLGTKNFRTSINYITLVNALPYNSSRVIATTDTSYTSRFFANGYKQYDIRIGFEELKGYQYSRLHIGADLIIGGARYENSYYQKTFEKDSLGSFVDNKAEVLENQTGYLNTNYFTVGLDVSFGFDWFLSDDFLFTFQLTPQFNYYTPVGTSKKDDNEIYGNSRQFVDFNLGFFDVNLIRKF
jgi:hypothetical protein